MNAYLAHLTCPADDLQKVTGVETKCYAVQVATGRLAFIVLAGTILAEATTGKVIPASLSAFFRFADIEVILVRTLSINTDSGCLLRPQKALISKEWCREFLPF